MGMTPYNPGLGQLIADNAGGSNDRGFIANLTWTALQAAAGSAAGVHAAVTSTGSPLVVTTVITNPPCARNITATAGGTAGDIKPIQVTIKGTNKNGDAITEVLPVFTENTAGSVVGAKAFCTITEIDIPTHDGNGATTSIGFGELIGLPYKLDKKRVLVTLNDGVVDTAPALTIDSTYLELNTVDFNGSLDGSVMDMSIIV